MYIKVKVTPGSKKELFLKIKGVYFEVSVREKAERNMANKRVKELLASHFGLPVNGVSLISGHHSRNKIFNIKE
ncbi:MAG: DUF167 domain-containing protein [Candidatus Vogelbacteria bacterium]|nr:DUF167 domain-containing protein [Candidatus Vogelbacteria bacterium]